MIFLHRHHHVSGIVSVRQLLEAIIEQAQKALRAHVGDEQYSSSRRDPSALSCTNWAAFQVQLQHLVHSVIRKIYIVLDGYVNHGPTFGAHTDLKICLDGHSSAEALTSREGSGGGALLDEDLDKVMSRLIGFAPGTAPLIVPILITSRPGTNERPGLTGTQFREVCVFSLGIPAVTRPQYAYIAYILRRGMLFRTVCQCLFTFLPTRIRTLVTYCISRLYPAS